MNTELLERIGLSKNEIKVYFALLNMDQASATPIVKKASIPNSKVYPILERLIKKGLASYVIKNNVKYFQASDPKNLIDYIDGKEKQLSNQKEEIKKLIPKIEAKRKNIEEKQEAIIYEGFEGVKSAFNAILKSLKKGEEYLVFTLGNELTNNTLRLFFGNYHKKREDKKIKVRLIAKQELRKTFLKYYKHKYMDVRYIGLSLPTGIFIYKNNIMTLVWDDNPTAFVITSKNNTEKYRAFFEEMWKQSK